MYLGDISWTYFLYNYQIAEKASRIITRMWHLKCCWELFSHLNIMMVPVFLHRQVVLSIHKNIETVEQKKYRNITWHFRSVHSYASATNASNLQLKMEHYIFYLHILGCLEHCSCSGVDFTSNFTFLAHTKSKATESN